MVAGAGKKDQHISWQSGEGGHHLKFIVIPKRFRYCSMNVDVAQLDLRGVCHTMRFWGIPSSRARNTVPPAHLTRRQGTTPLDQTRAMVED